MTEIPLYTALDGYSTHVQFQFDASSNTWTLHAGGPPGQGSTLLDAAQTQSKDDTILSDAFAEQSNQVAALAHACHQDVSIHHKDGQWHGRFIDPQLKGTHRGFENRNLLALVHQMAPDHLLVLEGPTVLPGQGDFAGTITFSSHPSYELGAQAKIWYDWDSSIVGRKDFDHRKVTSLEVGLWVVSRQDFDLPAGQSVVLLEVEPPMSPFAQ